MKAQSSVYIQLQNIYKAKARRDATEVLELVRRAPGGENIDATEVDLFCKNAAFIKLISSSDGGSPEGLSGVVGTCEFSVLFLSSCSRRDGARDGS